MTEQEVEKREQKEQWELVQEYTPPPLYLALHAPFSLTLLSYISPLVQSEQSVHLRSVVSEPFAISLSLYSCFYTSFLHS